MQGYITHVVNKPRRQTLSHQFHLYQTNNMSEEIELTCKFRYLKLGLVG